MIFTTAIGNVHVAILVIFLVTIPFLHLVMTHWKPLGKIQNIRWWKFHQVAHFRECSALFRVLGTNPKSNFQFFCPHHLLIQKVQTSLIMENGGRVSPPPPTIMTTPYTFVMCRQVNKQKHCTVNAPKHLHEHKFHFFALQ